MNYRVYLRLIRTKHYLKNFLVFLPILFAGYLFDWHYLRLALLAFVAFSFTASAVYVINDLKDRDLDKLHPKKKYRPLAAGQVSTTAAVVLIIILLALAALTQYFANPTFPSIALLSSYVLINVLYSFGFKNVPILDVSILSLGFVIRVLYGGVTADIEVSKWLYLAVLAFSFYLGLGKRRNEIRANGAVTRKVNRHYNQAFLDKNMYVCLGLTIAYYSLWAVDPNQEHPLMVWTIPVVIAIVMTYSLAVESNDSDGDPVSVITGNLHLLGLVGFYGLLMTYLVYV